MKLPLVHRRTWRRASAAAAFVLLFAAIPSARADGYNPFRAPKERVIRDVHAIALAPTWLPADLQANTEVSARLEAMLTKELEALGLRVVGSAAYERIWLQNASQLGNLYDPVTGQSDADKVKTCRRYTARELGRTSGVDAVAILLVSRGLLVDGWGEPLTWQGSRLDTSDFSVRGTWLTFGLTDLEGADLYVMERPIEWSDVYAWRGHEKRADGELVRESNNALAVQNVVRDLARAYGKWPGASEPAPAAGPVAADGTVKPETR